MSIVVWKYDLVNAFSPEGATLHLPKGARFLDAQVMPEGAAAWFEVDRIESRILPIRLKVFGTCHVLPLGARQHASQADKARMLARAVVVQRSRYFAARGHRALLLLVAAEDADALAAMVTLDVGVPEGTGAPGDEGGHAAFLARRLADS